MSSVPWTTVLTAVQDLFQIGSGLPDTRVLFARNGHLTTRPNGTDPWISLRFESSIPIDRPQTVEEEDPDGEPGAEIIQRTIASTRVAFQATAYPPETEDDATTAYAVLNDVVATAFTPPRLRALREAGIGLMNFEQVLRLDGALGSRIEPRATMLFAFTVTGEVITTTGFIETVNIDADIDDGARNFSFTVDLGGEDPWGDGFASGFGG
jgi:hypothetical protein